MRIYQYQDLVKTVFKKLSLLKYNNFLLLILRGKDALTFIYVSILFDNLCVTEFS